MRRTVGTLGLAATLLVQSGCYEIVAASDDLGSGFYPSDGTCVDTTDGWISPCYDSAGYETEYYTDEWAQEDYSVEEDYWVEEDYSVDEDYWVDDGSWYYDEYYGEWYYYDGYYDEWYLYDEYYNEWYCYDTYYDEWYYCGG
jgi:hypothetical protein